MLTKVFYGPGDWLATRLTVRQRRATATWLLIVVILTTPFQWPWKDSVALVWMISQVALAVAFVALVLSETPVEKEDNDKGGEG